MKLMRRIRGVRVTDKVRSEKILQELRASKLSDLISERQLRYCGHVERYPDDRWVKFAIRAVIPGQTKTGKQKQYCKSISKLLKHHDLTIDMMKDEKGTGNGWRTKLQQLYPKAEAKNRQPCTTTPKKKD